MTVINQPKWNRWATSAGLSLSLTHLAHAPNLNHINDGHLPAFPQLTEQLAASESLQLSK